MKKITGALALLGALMSLVLIVYLYVDEETDFENGLPIWLTLFVCNICTINYCLSTKFWTSKTSILESMDRENEIIKKQIEKRQLLAKLESIQGNEGELPKL